MFTLSNILDAKQVSNHLTVLGRGISEKETYTT